MPSSRSECVTALRPVHGPGCSRNRNRRALGRRRGEVLAEPLAEHGAGGGHVKNVSTPASTKARRPHPVEVDPRLAQHRDAEPVVDQQRHEAHHRDHRGDVQHEPERAGQQRRAVAAGGLDRVVVGRRVGHAGADQHRGDHQPGAVRAGHQERPPGQLAPVDPHRRPARVRARLDEAEDPEADQRDPRGQVQDRRVGQQPQPEDQRDDEHERELVPDRDRRQRADDRAAVAVLHAERDREQPAHRWVEAVVGPERGDDQQRPEVHVSRSGSSRSPRTRRRRRAAPGAGARRSTARTRPGRRSASRPRRRRA